MTTPDTAPQPEHDPVPATAAQIRPEDCPEPYWHKTHRYCPACSWHEAPCAQELRLAQGDLYVVECALPPGHEGEHESKIRWL